MKIFKKLSCGISFLIIILAACPCDGQSQNTPEYVMKNAVHLYKDGQYEGRSRARYTGEPYWGIATIKIENGIFKEVNFLIRDSNLHEDFSNKYAKHFKGNPLYIKQCRKDWGGVKKYPRELAKTQDVNDLDAISGATWSFNIFRASVNQALKNAYNEIDTIPAH